MAERSKERLAAHSDLVSRRHLAVNLTQERLGLWV